MFFKNKNMLETCFTIQHQQTKQYHFVSKFWPFSSQQFISKLQH